MVDVTQHKCFPTIINEFQFDMDKQEHDLVIDELNDMEKYKENNLITQTTDDLSKHIPKFTKKIYNITEHICEKYSYLYNRLEFTGMWANKLVKGEIHPPHTHSNNIFHDILILVLSVVATQCCNQLGKIKPYPFDELNPIMPELSNVVYFKLGCNTLACGLGSKNCICEPPSR